MVLKKLSNSRFIFLFIIIVTAFFRVTNLDIIEFKIDEASNLLLASLPIFGSSFAPGGIVTSIGILNTPLFNYLLFPILLISLKPQAVVFFIALANSMANGFFYLTIKKYYNNTLAVITTLLIAFSPWAILFSRKIWPPDLIFPFFIILFLSIHKILVDKETKFWVALIASSLFIFQLEMAAGFLILLMAIVILFQKPKLDLKYIFIGSAIGMLPLIPYFFYLLQGSCQGCESIMQVMGKKLFVLNFEVFARPFQILNQGNFRTITGGYMFVFAQNFPMIYKLKWIFYLEYLLLPIGAIIFWNIFKKSRFLFYMAFGLPILYFLFGIEAHMHYFIVIAPILFLFLATFFYFLISYSSFLKKLSLLFLSIIIIYSIAFNASFFKFIREFGGNLDGDYGLPINLSLKGQQDKFAKYKNNFDFEQIVISSYIPLYIMHGTSPFSQMVYPYEKTQKILSSLEQKLKDTPQDPRVLHQLVSYYSSIIPKKSTIESLREKTRNNPEYAKVYNEVYAFYLQENLKEVHLSPGFRILVEFPKHWDAEEIDDKILIKSSDYYIQLDADSKNFDKISKKLSTDVTYISENVKVLNTTTEKTRCLTKDKKWCGTIYNPIQFGSKTFVITYGYNRNNNNTIMKDYKDKELEFTLDVMDEIINSIREL